MHLMSNPQKFMKRELAESLVQKYGSALYVYNGDLIQEKARKLISAAEGFHVSYAMKANSNSQILKILKNNGINSVDVVSPGQIHKAIRNGYSPDQILYTENFISQDEMDYALKTGVTLNIGAYQTLEHFKQKLSGHEIFIRINPELGAGENFKVITGGPSSKFGIYFNQFNKVVTLAEENNIKIIGLHQHIGSNLKKEDKHVFLETTEYVFKLASKFKDVVNINIGGGIGIKYKPEEQLLDIKQLYNEVRVIRDKYSSEINRTLKVWIEPGRYLVGDAGILLCKITGKKKTPQKTFIGTDTGFNHLIRPALYGSYHGIFNLIPNDIPAQKTVVCGNICECTDILGNQIMISGNIGDILMIENTGAYGFSMASNYNQRCKPAEILLLNGSQWQIRRRQIFSDLFEKND